MIILLLLPISRSYKDNRLSLLCNLLMCVLVGYVNGKIGDVGLKFIHPNIHLTPINDGIGILEVRNKLSLIM